MSLRIRFINKTDYEPGLARGEITLNDFVEEFESSLALWTDPDDPYRSIPERRSVNAEGVQVSEWTVEFDSIGSD